MTHDQRKDVVMPTGRMYFDPPFDDFQRQVEAVQKRLQEAVDRFNPRIDDQGRRVLALAGDYSQLEAYVLAQLVHESERPVVLELGPAGGQIASVLDTGTRGAVVGPDSIHDSLYYPRSDPKEPMKQNGRSAAYLAHDPSKRYRRGRHG